jgi:hypothetical protein
MQKLQKKSIFIGFIVDLAGTWVVSFALGVAIGIYAVRVGADMQEIISSVLFITIATLIGCCFTVLGGFIASTRASYRHIAHGAWVGGVGLILAVPFTLLSWGLVILSGHPIETSALVNVAFSTVIAIPLGIAGGFLGKKFDERRQNAVTVSNPQHA